MPEGLGGEEKTDWIAIVWVKQKDSKTHVGPEEQRKDDWREYLVI